MADLMRPIPFSELLARISGEFRNHDSIFSIHKDQFYKDDGKHKVFGFVFNHIEKFFCPVPGLNFNFYNNQLLFVGMPLLYSKKSDTTMAWNHFGNLVQEST